MSNNILNQILQEMKSMNQRMDRMKTHLESVETTVQDTRTQMNSRFDTLETKVSIVENDLSSLKDDTAEIKVVVHRMAGEVPKDILGILKQINSKLEEKDYDIHTLNKRLFRVESTVERITVEKQ